MRIAIEEAWARLMRAALQGDREAYRTVLTSLSIALRTVAKRGLTRAGLGPEEADDIVQETLIAIHQKRHTWDAARPIGPWVSAIARHKLADALRRSTKRRIEVPIEEIAETLASTPAATMELDRQHIARLLAPLSPRERAVVDSVSLKGLSAREAGERLDMSEGAVRITLHRAFKALGVRRAGDPT